MPTVYTAQQKAAIQQFISFTQLDKSTAVRALKSHGWDAQNAVNAYYSSSNSSGGSQGSSAAKTNLNKLFDRYQEAGAPDKDIVGVEGTMRYFEDTGVDAEGLDALAALEIVQAPTMGEMSRDGFIKGWLERHCDAIDKQKAYLRNLKSELSGNKDVFTRVYKYTFTIAKTADQRAVPLEMATVYWELLFSSPLSAVQWSSPNTPWLTWWTEFLNTSWKKSVNKDMWNETLKFAQLSLEDETMSFWNEESSWPSVIDDFVEFVKKEKRGDIGEQPMDEDYY
ncbi:Cullin binding-domain-containing protein [Alternaria rosae]|uniref:Cullin binding-domain-containing protein n=1 Tax=Alternaria rosae TaxID=1187941 RepID=UPI001E8D0634|nr:Cullin binding-domain-containing protein [Alternaria rosae]KAH6875861.1 Cullin binding-domain-containing protein [Alternaria rosae]